MAAIDYLKKQGFSAKVSGARLVVSPASKLTSADRQYIKLHRLELIAELSTNDGQERRRHWSISVPGYRPFTMIGEPMTRAEALAAARWRWPDAEVSR
jgi:hypothetical protein